ncbi:MAG: hypothetical protein QHH15_00355 [Candidatus Thermoplasmatota archaeon]|nr:hypothetical protein [Candidatus Thermoplasmatota archaeon]
MEIFKDTKCSVCHRRDRQPNSNVCGICAGVLLKELEQQETITITSENEVKPKIVPPKLEEKCYICGKPALINYGGYHYCRNDIFKRSKSLRQFLIQLGKYRKQQGKERFYPLTIAKATGLSIKSVKGKFLILEKLGIVKSYRKNRRSVYTDLEVSADLVKILEENSVKDIETKNISNRKIQKKEEKSLELELRKIKGKLNLEIEKVRELQLKNIELKKTVMQCKEMLEQKEKEENTDSVDVLKLKAEIYDMRKRYES